MRSIKRSGIIKSIVIFAIISLLSTGGFVSGSVAPGFQWEHEYAGPGQVGDTVSCLIQTSDGGYVFGGSSSPYSFGGALPSTLITKTDSEGVVEWQKQYFYPSEYNRRPNCLGLVQTSDQGYIFAKPDNATSGFVLLKLDSSGNSQWNRTYTYNGCSIMVLTTDGGYAFAGTVGSTNPTVWLAKTNSVGNVQWYKTYDAKFDRGVTRLLQTQDGSYLIIGNSIIDPNFEGSPSTLIMFKTDSAGNLLWNKTYDADMSGWDGQSLIQTSDSNYVIVDNTNTSVAIFKTDQDGTVLWAQDYPSIGIINSIVETSDGGLALAGINGNSNSILRLAKTNSLGKLEWSITGGNLNAGPFAKFGVGVLFYNSGSCILEGSDGSLVIAGIADNQNFYDASYYLTKTQPFLPTPTSTPALPVVPSALPSNTPTTSPTSTQASQVTLSILALVAIIAVVIVIAGVAFYIFKRKQKI